MDTSYRNDPLFIEGRKMQMENNHEAAVEFFCQLLENSTSVHGDEALVCAPLWMEYGDALIRLYEENSSLMGSKLDKEVRKEAKKASAELATLLADKNEHENENEEQNEHTEQNNSTTEQQPEEEEQGVDEEDEVEDLQIAWESLEVARRVLEREQCADYDELLADVYERIGDINSSNTHYTDAIQDYSKCLSVRSSLYEDGDRKIATAHYNLALMHVYCAHELATDEENPSPASLILEHKRKALVHYKAALECLSLSNSDSDEAERSELCDELKETIQTISEEIDSNSNVTATVSTSAPTTTIGFGASAPMTSAVSNLQVKRKEKPPQNITSSSNENKRPKIE